MVYKLIGDAVEVSGVDVVVENGFEPILPGLTSDLPGGCRMWGEPIKTSDQVGANMKIFGIFTWVPRAEEIFVVVVGHPNEGVSPDLKNLSPPFCQVLLPDQVLKLFRIWYSKSHSSIQDEDDVVESEPTPRSWVILPADTSGQRPIEVRPEAINEWQNPFTSKLTDFGVGLPI